VKLLFWLLWTVDAVVAAVFVYFFFAGLADGSVSSFNIVLWSLILLGLAGILGGGPLLRAKVHPLAGLALVALLAVPGLLAALLLLVLLVAQRRWN
jgi:hypothetical protein